MSIVPKAPVTIDELHTSIMRFHQYLRCYRDESGRTISEQFKKLPLREEDPEYYDLVSQPISFLMIRNRIDKLKYTSLSQWYSDVELLLSNARLIATKRPSASSAQIFKDIDALQNLLNHSIRPQIFSIPKLEVFQPNFSSVPEGFGRSHLVKFLQSTEHPQTNSFLFIGDSISFIEGTNTGKFFGWIVKIWKSSNITGVVLSLFLRPEQLSIDIRQTQISSKEIFATPILRIIPVSAIVQKVSISLFGAPNLISSVSDSSPSYSCNYLYDTSCSRVYPCNFSLLSHSLGANNISERREDTFSILPSLQHSLQSRKRVGESIKVGCSFSSTCTRTFNLLEGLCRHATDHIPSFPEFQSNMGKISPQSSHTTFETLIFNLPDEIVSSFDQDKQNRMLWFPTPPLNPIKKEGSIHSVEYLLWRALHG